MALLNSKMAARTAKMVEVDKAEKVEEVRALGTELEAINVEIRSIEEMIAEIKDEPTNERTAAVNGETPGSCYDRSCRI